MGRPGQGCPSQTLALLSPHPHSELEQMAVLVTGKLRSHPAGHYLSLEVHDTPALRALVLPTSYNIHGFFQEVPPSTPSTMPIRFSNTEVSLAS